MNQEKAANLAPPDHQRPPHEGSGGKKKTYWAWIIVFLGVGLIVVWAFYHHDEGKGAQPSASGGRRGISGPITIATATAQTGDIGVYLDAIGTVTALYTDSITAQVTGVITAVHYKEGQEVKKDDPLIDIDPRPYEATVIQAQGALERDQNILAQAQMDLERYKDAWARNAIPRQTYEDQEKIVLQDQGTVKNDEGTLRYDQVQLAYCHITAPINGRVGLRLVDPGNLVTASATTTLVVITEMQPITVVATISEDSLPEVLSQPHHGIDLPIEAWDRANEKKIAGGKVISFDNQIDTTTGTVKVRAQFDNKKGALYPNEFVNTRLLVKTLHDQILLPSSAVQHNGSAAFVYVIQNSKGSVADCGRPNQDCSASMRNVKTGVSEGGKTAVQGVNEGEVVADSSFDKLQNGVKIVVSETPLPTTSSQGNAQ